jgi:hypothetical protein
MSVYFMTCRDVNMVKIGYSDRVRARFAGVRVCCPLDVSLELMLPGGKDEEKKIHALLNRDRVRGEWFWITETVERFIANPPPPPKEYPDLTAPYTDLAQHELLIKRLQRKRRAARVPVTEADKQYLSRLAAEKQRQLSAAEKERATTHRKGTSFLEKLEAKGDIYFPFRQLEEAD